MEDKLQFINRIKDLAMRSYHENRFVFSDFLTVGEMSDLLSMTTEDIPSGYSSYGGYDDAERCMVRFGRAEELGYEEDYPIGIVRVRPIAPKFAEKLGHRDYMGSVLNLGLERKVIGDILVGPKEAYIICQDNMCEFLMDNLSRIRHTQVLTEKADEISKDCLPKLEEMDILLASERIDAAVAHVYKLSRSGALELFRSRKVFVDGREMTDPSATVHDGSLISVRGYGRFRYIGEDRVTKKGKISVRIEKYV